MAPQLQDRRIVVTGAEGAFGRATIELLEAGGARVVGIDRTPATRDLTFVCDIADAAAVDDAVARAATELGGIDVLVNNAGIGTAGSLALPFGPEDRAVLDVNAVGCWNMTRATLPWLLAAERGQVVNVASLLAVISLPYVGAYAASKRAVCALSDTLRLEHPGVLTVSTIYPGYVPTGIHTPVEARTGMSLAGLVPQERLEQVAGTIVRAIRRPRRHHPTSPLGRAAFVAARHAPVLVERLIAREVRRREMPIPDAWRATPVVAGPSSTGR